jgi:hypothetical protein
LAAFIFALQGVFALCWAFSFCFGVGYMRATFSRLATRFLLLSVCVSALAFCLRDCFLFLVA